MSTPEFDLAGLLKNVSNLNTQEQIVYLPLDQIDPDPENFYSLDGLDELAGNIELCGLLDPIRVRPTGERWTVVSGHRRRAACLLIRDGGSEQFKNGVPCIIEYGEASDAMRKLRLIYANSNTRQLTSAEQSKQAEEVTRLLYELKEQGVVFPGRMRDHVAQACNLTKSKIARLQAIRNRAQEYVLDAFDQGKINEAVAYELSRASLDLQRMIMVQLIRSGRPLTDMTAEQVSTISSAWTHMCNRPCKMDPWKNCKYVGESHFEEGLRRRFSGSKIGNCQKGFCCKGCPALIDCDAYCEKLEVERQRLIDAQEQRRAEVAKIADNLKTKEAQAKTEADEKCTEIWARIHKAAEETGRNLESVFSELCESNADVQQALRFCSGEEKDIQHFGIDLLDDCFIDLADLLGCSVDFLLGRTDVPKVNRGEAAVSAVDTALAWQTGQPARDGWYATKIRFLKEPIPQPRVYWWDGEQWLRDREKNLSIDKSFEVTGWISLPEEG